MKVKVEECPAGPHLDAAIAKIQGWTDLVFDAYTPVGRRLCGTHPSGKGGFYNQGRMIVTQWSSGIAAAWELVEESDLFTDNYLTKNEDNKYVICPDYIGFGEWPEYYEGADENVALVITRAFLKAHRVKEIEVPDEASH
jgi:hypothetical protein